MGDKPLLPIADIESRYYLRFGVADRPGVLGQLTTILGTHGVSIAQVVQDGPRAGANAAMARVFVVTHLAREGDVQAALAEIARLGACVEPGRLIRIAGEAGGAR
jgi:homoserine dehydrogenase